MIWNRLSYFGTIEDTLYNESGKPYLHYRSGKMMSFKMPLQLKSSQRILLPKTDCRNGKVIIRYRNKDITKARISASLYDITMNCIGSYSTNFPAQNDTACISFPLQKAIMLTLNINLVEVSSNNSGFDIYGIDIYLDGRNIDSFPLNMGKYDKLSSLKKNKSLPEIPDKRIVGIGENMHGTSTLPQIGIEIIKDRILNHNCRLVLLERSPEYIISLNHFAKDKSCLVRNDVKDIINIIGKEWFDFICWVNDFNEKTANKVLVAGIDNVDTMHSNLKYLIYIMSQKYKNHNFDNILSCIIDEDLYECLKQDTFI